MNIGTLTVILSANTVGLTRAARAMQQLERTTGMATAGMTAAMKKQEAATMAASTAAVNLGRSLTQFVTVPMTILGAVSMKTFADFEYNLAKIEGLVGIAESKTKAWGKSILDLSKAVGKGPVELADALYFITSSGFKGAEAMEILNITSKAAAAGLGEVKFVADVVTSAMNAYRGTNLTAARATDILVTTIREGKGEVDKMVASMGVALPIASKLGVGMDQVGAAMAAMTRVGTTVATSAVQTRQMFNSLLKPAKQSKDAIRAMGSSYEELRNILKQQGLTAMLQKVMDLTGGNTAAMARLFPNIRALNGIIELTGENFETFKKVQDEITNSTGATDEAFEIIQKTLKQKLNVEVARLQVILIKLGNLLKEIILPIITGFVNALEWLGNVFGKLPLPIQLTFAGLGLIVTVLGPLILLVKSASAAFTTFFIPSLGATAAASTTVAASFTATTTVFSGFSTSAMTATSAVGGLSKGMGLASISVMGWIGIVVAVTAALATWYVATRNQTEAQKKLNDEIEKKYKIQQLPEGKKLLNELGILDLVGKGFTTGKYSFTKQAEDMALASLKGMSSNKVAAARTAIIEEMVNLKKQIQKAAGPEATVLEMEQQFAKEGTLAMYQRLLPVMDQYIKADEEYRKSLMLDEEALGEVNKSLEKYQEAFNSIILKQQMFGKTYDASSDLLSAYKSRLDDLAEVSKTVTPEMQKLADAIMNIESAMKMSTMASISWQDSIKGFDELTKIQKTIMGANKGTPYEFNDKGKVTGLMPVGTLNEGEVSKLQNTLKLIDGSLRGNIDLMQAWKTAGNALVSIFEQLGQMIGGVFGEAIDKMTPYITLLTKMLTFLKAIGVIEEFNAAKKAANTAVTSASIPVTIAATAAQQGLAAANTEVAITGAAASVSWLPIVGIGLAIAGVAALIAVLASSKKRGANMASGGIVPSGYPNDSFSANLTSNEAVIPLDRMPQLLGIGKNGGKQQVEFIIEGRVLKGILKDANMMGGIA